MHFPFVFYPFYVLVHEKRQFVLPNLLTVQKCMLLREMISVKIKFRRIMVNIANVTVANGYSSFLM